MSVVRRTAFAAHSFLCIGHARISQVNIFFHLLKKSPLFFMAGLWLCATTGAMAVTLGPNIRSAVLGQPLALSVQMMPEADDDPAMLCLDADVFYADRQMDKSLVQVTAEKPVNAQAALIHIRAVTPVEGPVVTVHLRAGCVRKTTRRYVVLAVTKPRSGLSADSGLQALAAPAPDSFPGAGKVQALEAELRQLREELQKSQAALAEGRIQLEKAQREGYRKELVYGLAGMLSLAFAGLIFLLRQRPSAFAASPESGPSAETPVSPGTSLEPDSDIHESLVDDLKRPSRHAPPESIPPLPARDRARFSVSVPFVQRTVKVPELFDLQQQVEFFTSLGQNEKAITLLRKHLVDNVKTSALVYLDLLDLYHRTGNKEDYEVLRADFNRVFKGSMAPFDGYTPGGFGAAAHEAALARIQAVWPTRQVFDVIDDALFREPGNAADLLGMEAYRDLLLLHGVAREIIEIEAGATGHGGDSHGPDLMLRPRASPRLGLDIDLSQFSGDSDGPGETADSRTGANSPAADKASLQGKSNPNEPTVLDSLIDFDDYDTGLRPDDFGKSARS